jgi:hypothetical protein
MGEERGLDDDEVDGASVDDRDEVGTVGELSSDMLTVICAYIVRLHRFGKCDIIKMAEW